MTGSFSVISVIFHIVIQLFKRHIEQIPGSQEGGGGLQSYFAERFITI